MSETHAPNWNGDNRTLCGLAAEGECRFGSNDGPAPVFAEVGESITCFDCLSLIKHVHRCIKRTGGGFARAL